MDPEVILVDDSTEDAELTIRALKKFKLASRILHLADGSEALEYMYVTNSTHLPKLIILDIEMPKVGGIEVLRKLKNDEAKRLIPIVVMSSSLNERHISESYSLGVNGYVVKQPDYSRYMETVRLMGAYWMIENRTPSLK